MEKKDEIDKNANFNNKEMGANFIILSIAFLFLPLAFYSITNLGLTSDEGIYVMAAKKAVSGQIPYRDFSYSQTPILPYINGILMKLIGFGQIQIRIIGELFTFLSLVLCMITVLKRRNLIACFICGWILVTTPIWVGWNVGVNGATNFFMALTGMVICLTSSYNKKIVLFSIFGTLAIACRLTVAPTIIILWLYLILDGNNYKQRVKAIISFVIAEMIIFLPFIFASPENFIFWNLGYHLKSELHRRIFYEHILCLPSIFILILSGIAIVVILKKKIISAEVAMLIAATVGIIIQMVLKVSYGVYSLPFVPMCVIGGTIILSDFRWKKYLYLLLLIFPLIYLTPLSPLNYLPLRFNTFIDKNWINTLNHAESFLREHTHDHGYILTPFPILAIQSDRNVFDGLEMGMFGLTDEINENQAKKLHFMHYEELLNIVAARKAEAIILNNYASEFNFSWSSPSFTRIEQIKRELLFDLMAKYYLVGFEETPLLILLPK